MRLIELRLKNLNSLKGEWHIDFADPAFINEGIFAITGQTGAGKTTILDAICLALYGETPRINSISKSSNEVMTRQTADCFAEVVIDLNDIHYRCRWGQRRAYGKSDGNLQDATHEIALVKPQNGDDDNSGDEILETKLSRTKDKIVELTRMDFQQFTRSILLAQGSFSAFLKAKADERADILEKITGTDIYATISTHVHEKKRFEEEILSKLQVGLQGLTLLDTDEENALSEQLKSHQLAQAEQQQIYKQLNEQINWLDAVSELNSHLTTYKDQLDSAQHSKDAFIPNSQRLIAANKALEIDSQYSQLNHSRDALESLQIEHVALTTKLPAQKTMVEQASATLNAADTYSKSATDELQATLPTIAKVRTVDADIKQQTHILHQNKQRQEILSSNVQRLIQEIDHHKQIMIDSQSQLADIDKNLENNSKLSDLDTDMATFDSRCSRLKALLQDNAALAIQKRASDQKINHHQMQWHDLLQKQATDKSMMAETRLHLLKVQQQQAALTADKSIIDIRDEQEQINYLNSQIEPANHKLEQLCDLLNQISQINTSLPILSTELNTLNNYSKDKQSEITQLKQKRQDKQTQLNLLQQVATLEDYIIELKDDSPCPLCGATEHPYAKSHPHLDKNPADKQSPTQKTQQILVELDEQISTLEQELSNYKIEQATKHNRLEQYQQQLNPWYEQAKTLITESQESIAKLVSSDNSYSNTVATILNPLNNIGENINSFRQSLANKANEIELVDGINEIQSKLTALKQHLTQLKMKVRDTLTEYENLTQSLSKLTQDNTIAEQQHYQLASDISAIETDIKLNKQQLDSLNDKTSTNFLELATISTSVLALMDKYLMNKCLDSKSYGAKDTLTPSHLSEPLQPLLSSIKQQLIIDEAEIDQVIAPLRQQRISLMQLKNQFNKDKDDQQILRTKLSSLNAQIETKQGQLDSQEQELSNLSQLIVESAKVLEELRHLRQTLFADKQADIEEGRLRFVLEQAKTSQASLQRQLDNAEQILAQWIEKIQQISSQLIAASTSFDTQQLIFKAVLATSDFIDEPDFVKARLPVDERNMLNEQQQQINYTLKQAQAQWQQTQQTLDEKQANALTAEDKETLVERQQQTQNHSNRLIEAIGAMSQQLKDNEDKKGNQHSQREAIALQQQHLKVWLELHKLIGSADGKKYRTFAQGLTFDIMVSHANTQLQKMSDRYLLARDDNNPLELNVIDNYQGGEIRSTKNLSGGEGFIISLALALGLSQMASQNIRVDSLFLDEGFGTLDDESLDIALDTLTNLQQEGKMIGVISHVQALKERILTQIQVTKLSGGYSQISGQGCYHIAS